MRRDIQVDYSHKDRIKRRRVIRLTIGCLSLALTTTLGARWMSEYNSLAGKAAEFNELENEFQQARDRHSQLQKIEASLEQQLNALETRSVVANEVAEIRDRVITMVRKAGASLRRLEISDDMGRSWAKRDDDPKSGSMPLYAEPSRFRLVKHRMQLRADGKMEAVETLLHEIQKQEWLSSTLTLALSPTESPDMPVSLDLTLMMYGLEVQQESTDGFDEFAKLHRRVLQR